jgi:hypothetical protein
VTKVIENIEAIVSEPQTVYVLEVDAECVLGFLVDEFWSPGRVGFEVMWVKLVRCTGGCGGL